MSNDATQTISGGEAIARLLRANGINTVFALAGTAHAYLLDDLDKAGFHIIPSRSENATIAAADGYARVTGKPGFALIVGHQGLPNSLGGIRTAQLACSPVIVLAGSGGGQPESLDEESNDLLDIVKPFVKYAKAVPSPARLEEYFSAAMHKATSGRPGVAVLDIPTGFAREKIDAKPQFPSHKLRPAVPEPGAAAIAEAAALLRDAKRPLILCGSGAAMSEAGAALRQLAETLKAPVFGHALGRGLVPEDNERSFSWGFAQVAAKHADVVLAIGIRLQQRIGFGMAPRFDPDARFIQIDIEPGEIGRNRTIDIPIQADANISVQRLNAALADGQIHSEGRAWVKEAIAVRSERLASLTEADDPIHPLRIGQELMKQMPPETIFVADGADVYNWMTGIVRIRAERSYMDHYPLGSMGICTALALGAAAGARECAEETGGEPRPVVLVTGDGSFGFYPAEFNSAQLAGLRIICVVANDGAWGTEKNAQLNAYGRVVNCEIGQCDYHLIGHAFGCRGEKVTRAEDIAPALERAFAASESTILNILTDPDAGLVRKKDPRLQMVTFEDLKSSLDAHHVMNLA